MSGNEFAMGSPVLQNSDPLGNADRLGGLLPRGSMLQDRGPLKIVDAALLPNRKYLHNLWTPSLKVVGG